MLQKKSEASSSGLRRGYLHRASAKLAWLEVATTNVAGLGLGPLD